MNEVAALFEQAPGALILKFLDLSFEGGGGGALLIERGAYSREGAY